MSRPATRKISYDDFLEAVEDGVHAEWVDGEVRFMSPASERHQRIVQFIGVLLQVFVEDRAGGRVLLAPFQMKTGPDLPGREPDVLYIAEEHLGRLRTNFLDGPADLAVEVISPDSRSRDRGDKFSEYERGGVREYWLVDPRLGHAEFHVRGTDGLFSPRPAIDGIYRSVVLEGFWLKTDWLSADAPPTVLGVLKEWGLV